MFLNVSWQDLICALGIEVISNIFYLYPDMKQLVKHATYLVIYHSAGHLLTFHENMFVQRSTAKKRLVIKIITLSILSASLCNTIDPSCLLELIKIDAVS